jgi:hypothetical protein
MSPLWPDFAIARAARATALSQGLIEQRDEELQPREPRSPQWPGEECLEKVRRPLRRPVASYAL